MTNTVAIEEIERQALQDEVNEAADQGGGETMPAVQSDGGVAAEFAAFLNMAAGIAGQGLNMPTIPQRFNEGANLQIAQAAVELCKRYGLDPRKALIGGDSVVGLWIGLIVSISLPGMGIYNDYRVMRAKEVKSEGADDAGKQPQQ